MVSAARLDANKRSLASAIGAGIISPGAGGGLLMLSAIVSGQSNAEYLYNNSRGEFEAYMNANDPLATWKLADGATNGSATLEINKPGANPTFYWWDDVADVQGPCMADWKVKVDAERAAGRTVSCAIWNQGEGDAGFIGSSTGNATRYRTNLVENIFAEMRAYVPGLRIFILPMNRRGTANGVGAVNIAGYERLREMHVELAQTFSTYITLLPEMFDQPDDGGAHSVDSGYDALVPRISRKILKTLGRSISGGVDGPRMTAAALTGNEVLVTIAHDGGTDITPATGIQGFVVKVDGVEVAISAAVGVDATHVRLTLATTPTSGVPVVTFGDGILVPQLTDYTKVLRDNQAVPLPLRFGELTLPAIAPPQPGYGPNLNPDPGVDDPTQYAVSNAADAQVANGVLRMKRNSNFFGAALRTPFPESGQYRVVFTIKNYVGGQFQLKEANSTASGDITGSATLVGTLFNANGTFEAIVTGTAAKYLTFKAGGSASNWEWELDDIQFNKVL